MAVVIARVTFKLTDFYNNRHVGLFFSFFRHVNSLQEGGEGSGGGEGGEGDQQAEARSTLAKFRSPAASLCLPYMLTSRAHADTHTRMYMYVYKCVCVCIFFLCCEGILRNGEKTVSTFNITISFQ